jgi:hypothetical protein
MRGEGRREGGRGVHQQKGECLEPHYPQDFYSAISMLISVQGIRQNQKLFILNFIFKIVDILLFINVYVFVTDMLIYLFDITVKAFSTTFPY